MSPYDCEHAHVSKRNKFNLTSFIFKNILIKTTCLKLESYCTLLNYLYQYYTQKKFSTIFFLFSLMCIF